MTTTGRIVVANGQNFEIQEHTVPDPPAHGLLVKQELAGICGTDLHMWQNGIPRETVLGHENVGIVVAMGKDVKTDYVGNPVKEGDRVIFAPGTTGGEGAYGFMPPPSFFGGFADYIMLSLAETCYITTTAPPEVAVLTEPFTVGVHAVLRGGVKLGDTVVIQGSGAIGLLTLVAAKVSGAGRLIMVGGPAHRLALAKKLGADVVIDIDDVTSVEERIELVKSHTDGGKGADIVFECAGFLPATIEGLQYVRHSGCYVEVGHFVDMGSIELNINQLMMRRNLTFEAIWGSKYDHFVRGLPILERNELPFAELVSHTLPLERVLDGFNALDQRYELD
ncbi:MAG: zinc-binding dehydrogenase, partial [Chloroflexota bacterium]